MKKQEPKDPLKDFEGYEDAREVRKDTNPKEASEKAVKAALNRINPDENTQERG